MTNLYVMVGLVGSGKSTFAKLIERQLNLMGSRVVYISSDVIRGELLGDENDQSQNGEVFKEVHRRINNSIHKNNVIVDATNLTVKTRRPILDLVKDNPEVNVVAEVMCTPLAICKKQNASRERIVPEFVIDKQVRQFEIPFYEEGFDDINLIGWNSGFFDMAGREISPIEMDVDYIPELMKGFDQKTHHHAYTLDVHCKKCAEELRKRTDNEALIRAGEIHDLGKLYTGEPKEDGSGEYRYYSHQNVGTYYLLQNIDCIGFTDYEKIMKTLFYCNYHMLPFFLETEKSKRKWAKIMGKTLLDDLFLFNECDKIASGTPRK